jgi:predicted DNA-binding protein YlxM (UPF0122 family)
MKANFLLVYTTHRRCQEKTLKIMKNYQDLSYEFLYNEYIQKEKSIRNIAKDTGLTKKQIQRLIKKFKIKIRQNYLHNKTKYKDILTKNFLYNEYIEKDMSINEISKNINIPSNTIGKYLNIHKIPRKIGGTRKNKKNKKLFNYKNDIKIGHKCGKLSVEFIDKNQLHCRCECGNIKIVHSSRIRLQQIKSCGCLIKRRGTESPLCKGVGNIPKSVFNKCKTNATDRNIDFNLTIEDLDYQYKKQNGKCLISGINIGFHDDKKKSKILSTASLDRIDSNKPYTIDNIQWIHKKIQQMKWDTSQYEFIQWCKIISQNNS